MVDLALEAELEEMVDLAVVVETISQITQEHLMALEVLVTLVAIHLLKETTEEMQGPLLILILEAAAVAAQEL
jgi:hypothetical protein